MGSGQPKKPACRHFSHFYDHVLIEQYWFFLLSNLTFKCQRISLAFLTRYGRVMPSTYHEVIRLCIHDKKLSFMTSQVCACVLLSLYIINKIKLNNISNNKINKNHTKTQRHQSRIQQPLATATPSFWRHSTSSFMSEICSDKWQERGEREQLIEWKWIAWSQFHHSWFVMIRDDACLAALPVEIYLLFDFNMFNSVIFVVMVKKWWKWTPWKGENSVAQQNNLQSTSIYIKLQKPAQCCSASLSCCNLHSWNIWNPRLLAANTWKPTQHRAKSKAMLYYLNSFDMLCLKGPNMGAVRSTTGEPT